MAANSKTMIRVVKRDNPYLTIDKTGINDCRISWKAKGLLCYLLGLPDDWKIYIDELKNHSSDGRDSTASALKELIKFGYCTREQIRGEKGRVGGYLYTIHEIPIDPIVDIRITPEIDSPETDNPFTEKPNTDNPELLINNYTKDLNNYITNQSIISDDGSIDEREIVKKRVSEQIDQQYLSEKYPHENIIADINELITEVITTKKSKIRISGEEKNAASVKALFKKIDSSHVEYVIESFKGKTEKIKNIDAYIKTSLYNSVMTSNLYYLNAVKSE